MDVPAFSSALIGLYFFTKFYYTKKNKYLIVFAVCYALAGLLKISSMIGFIAIFILFMLEALGLKLKSNGKLFSAPLKQSLVFAGVYMLLLAWYFYARSYNEKYNAGNFLLGILPIWDFNYAQITEMLNSVTEHIKWSYFRRETQLVYVLMLIFILINHRKVNRTLLFATILIALGFAGFIILFFQALAHDYYVTNMLILVPFLLLTFMLLLKTSYQNIFNSFIFRFALVLFLFHNIDFAGRRITERYSPDGWQNSNYIKNVHIFEEITPYLRSVGIQKDDRVISLSDNSINITLYLMNQKGWTNYGLEEDSTQIRQKIASGAKYLLIYDKRNYKNPTILPFLKNKIGEYKSVDIYRL
jgi:hypothetical protein